MSSCVVFQVSSIVDWWERCWRRCHDCEANVTLWKNFSVLNIFEKWGTYNKISEIDGFYDILPEALYILLFKVEVDYQHWIKSTISDDCEKISSARTHNQPIVQIVSVVFSHGLIHYVFSHLGRRIEDCTIHPEIVEKDYVPRKSSPRKCEVGYCFLCHVWFWNCNWFAFLVIEYRLGESQWEPGLLKCERAEGRGSPAEWPAEKPAALFIAFIHVSENTCASTFYHLPCWKSSLVDAFLHGFLELKWQLLSLFRALISRGNPSSSQWLNHATG